MFPVPALIFAGSTATVISTFSEKDYFAAKSFPLHTNPNGTEGKLLLFQDRGLKSRKQRDRRLVEEYEYYNGPKADFKNAYLVIQNADGKLFTSIELDNPWADLRQDQY